MEECLSIWKNLDTVITTYQSDILSGRGYRTICIFSSPEILLTSLLSILSGSQGQDAYACEHWDHQVGLICDFLLGFTWLLSNCNAKTPFSIFRMQHVCSHSLIFFQPVYYVWQGLIFLEFKALWVCNSNNKCIYRKRRPSLIYLCGCSENFSWIKQRELR